MVKKCSDTESLYCALHVDDRCGDSDAEWVQI